MITVDEWNDHPCPVCQSVRDQPVRGGFCAVHLSKTLKDPTLSTHVSTKAQYFAEPLSSDSFPLVHIDDDEQSKNNSCTATTPISTTITNEELSAVTVILSGLHMSANPSPGAGVGRALRYVWPSSLSVNILGVDDETGICDPVFDSNRVITALGSSVGTKQEFWDAVVRLMCENPNGLFVPCRDRDVECLALAKSLIRFLVEKAATLINDTGRARAREDKEEKQKKKDDSIVIACKLGGCHYQWTEEGCLLPINSSIQPNEQPTHQEQESYDNRTYGDHKYNGQSEAGLYICYLSCDQLVSLSARILCPDRRSLEHVGKPGIFEFCSARDSRGEQPKVLEGGARLAQYYREKGGKAVVRMCPDADDVELDELDAAVQRLSLLLHVPPYIELSATSSAVQVMDFAQREGFPLLLKGRAQGAWQCVTMSDVQSIFARSLQPGSFLQRFIPGFEKCLAFSAWEGKLLGVVLMEKVDTTAEGKVWSGNISSAPQSLVDALSSFCAAGHWSGGGEVEYVQTLDGLCWVIDFNPRFPAWIAASHFSGVNLPALLVAAASAVLFPWSATSSSYHETNVPSSNSILVPVPKPVSFVRSVVEVPFTHRSAIYFY